VNVDLGDYRYLRYRAPNGSYGNVAEIEFYRAGVKLTGTGFGTPGSWNNVENTFAKALDGNVQTYFDGPVSDGNFVGIDIGDAAPGTGLRGEYYNDNSGASYPLANPFAGSPVLIRTDVTVDFDWGGGSPDASISSDHFSARWTGQVQPQYSETYTFYTNTDDGVRLWVDGKLLIDTWQDQGPTEWSGTIDLSAGQKYDLRMEYYENDGGAVAKLLWSSASRGKQIIPQERLFPVSSPPDNEPPTVAQAAAAGYLNPGGVTVDLTVLGADDGGESARTYTWSTTGTPPASVSFSDNSTNAAKTTTAQFHEVGTHPLRVVIQDAQGLGVTSDVTGRYTRS
jgi:hypothetical protein